MFTRFIKYLDVFSSQLYHKWHPLREPILCELCKKNIFEGFEKNLESKKYRTIEKVDEIEFHNKYYERNLPRNNP